MKALLKVKISMPGIPERLDLETFIGNKDNVIDGFQFFLNQNVDDPDIWIIVEDTSDCDRSSYIAQERIAFVSAETSWRPGFYSENLTRSKFIEQFKNVYTCHDVYLPSVTNAPPFLPWMINSNHGLSYLAAHERDINFLGGLSELKKTKEISVFCSDQMLTDDHKMRFQFVSALKKHFGDRLDWFGNGVNSIPEKWEGIAPYRYTIVLENKAVENVFTEKIYDAYLGLAYPIYWGAPNLGEYFNSDGFTKINIRDLKGSIKIIEYLLSSSVAEEQQSAILENRNRVLGELNIFNRFAAISRELISNSPNPVRERVFIFPLNGNSSSKVRGGVLGIAGRALLRTGNSLISRSKS